MADKFVINVPVTFSTPNYVAAAVLVRNPSNSNENQILSNPGTALVFLGQTSGVTAATGTPFPPGSELKLIRNGLPIWAIANQTANTTPFPSGQLQLSAGVEPT